MGNNKENKKRKMDVARKIVLKAMPLLLCVVLCFIYPEVRGIILAMCIILEIVVYFFMDQSRKKNFLGRCLPDFKKEDNEWKKLEMLAQKVSEEDITDVQALRRIIKKFYLFHERNRKKIKVFSMASISVIVIAAIVSGLITSFIFPNVFKSKAATYTWEQTSWAGGATGNNGVHPGNQVGWTEYQAKDANLDAGTEISLVRLNSSSVQTSNTDFNAGTLSNTALIGSGNDASISLGINSVLDWSANNYISNYDTPGTAMDVLLVGNYAYISDSTQGLQIIDVSDPNHPSFISNLSTGSNSLRSTFINGNFAYLASYFGGLIVANIADPLHPAQVGSLATGSAYDVFVSGNYAYVADGSAGLRVINVADPAHPAITTTLDTPGSARGVSISGNYAYVTDYGSGLQVIDITDPAHPSIVGNYDTSGNAQGIYLSGNYAYVADDTQGLQVINITDPAHPSLAANYKTPDLAYNLFLNGSYLYLADYSAGLMIFDVSTPQNPILTGYYNTPGSCRGVYVTGNYGYVADATSGLQIINISSPLAPALSGSYNTPGSSRKLALAGNYAYVADLNGGLQIIDVSNPLNPTLAGSFSTIGSAYAVYILNGYAYVAEYSDGMEVVNISDPLHPIHVGNYNTTGYGYGISVSGNYVYLADGPSGLQIIDISDPAHPALAGTCDTPGNANGVFVSGNYAYVADENLGLQVINISSPASPVIAGSFSTGSFAKDITVVGNYAYMATHAAGLQIIDISDPAHPNLFTTYNTPGYAYGVTISGNYAYIADYDFGLDIIDITDLGNIVLKGFYFTGNNVYGVGTSGKYVYLADDAAGLKIISTGSYKPTGTFTSSVIDTGQKNDSWGTISWNTTIAQDTQIVLKAKSSTAATIEGIESCPALATITAGNQSGSQALDGANCINAGDRYIAYYLSLTTSNNANTPLAKDIAIAYNYYSNTQTLTSSPYDSSDVSNVIGKIEWIEDTPQGTDVKFQLRTAASIDELSAAQWLGPTGAGDYYTSSTGLETINSAHTSGLNDRWIQYKAYLVSDGTDSPTLSDVTLTYVVNAHPDVQNVTAVQNANGTVSINYEVRDIDTNTAMAANQGHVTPSFKYWDGAAWQTCTHMAAGDTDNKAVNTEIPAEFTTYVATWRAAQDFSGRYMANAAKIKVIINDNEMANNLSESDSGVFTLDTKAPTSASVKIDATANPATLTLAASDDSSMQMKISLTEGEGTLENYAVSKTISLASEPDTVYVQFIDAYGNITNVSAATPETPSNMIIRDISNAEASEYQLFVAWKVINNPAGGFKNYKVYTSTDNHTYNLESTIADRNLNYYADFGLDNNTTYYYKIYAEDNNGDISAYSPVVSDKPDGQGGTDKTPPAITNVATSSVSTTQAAISWDTDEESNSFVEYMTQTGGDFSLASSKIVSALKNNAAGLGKHRVTIDNLTPNTTYYFQVKSQDIAGNTGISKDGANGYSFTTLPGATISGVSATSITNTGAVINWNTDVDSDSHVYYSTNSDMSGSLEKGDVALGKNHAITLTSLNQGTTYYYYVKSTADSNDAIDNNSGEFYTFITSEDTTGPEISSATASIITDTSAVITWNTNERATSKVIYGTASGELTLSSNENANLDLSHSVTLSSLNSNTKYYYKVISTDGSNNSTTGPEGNFTTQEKLSTETEVTQRETNARSQGGGGGILIIDKTDKIAPIISDIKVLEIKSKSALLSWRTDENANSFVEYGTSANYGDTSGIYDNKKDHLVTLKNLLPEKDYNFRVLSADNSGNVSFSPNQTFRTIKENTEEEENDLESEDKATSTKETTEPIKNNEEAVLNAASAAQKAMDLITKLASRVSVATVEKTLSTQFATLEKISEIIPPPLMSSEPKVQVTANTATVLWKTDKKSNSLVAFAPDSIYKIATDKNNPYIGESGNREEKVTEHTVKMYELKPETLYHYQIKSESEIGPPAKSEDFMFKTSAESLEIIDYSVEIVAPEKATFKWVTNHETNAMIKYIPYRDNKLMVEEEKTIEEKLMSSNHEITIENFETGIIYNLELSGKDKNGKIAIKSIPTFSTGKDDLPPVIYQVQTDSALSPGKDTKTQTIISWFTNEPSTSRIYFEKGISNSEEFSEKTNLDTNYTKKHVVIITKFEPGTAYRFRVESMDSGGNTSLSNTFTILTPQQRESVFQIIMKNIEKTFGWVSKIR